MDFVGEIIARFERRGYGLVGLKTRARRRDAREKHYAEHEGKPFFAGLVEYITSAPVVAMIVQGSDAIEGCRATIGATNPIKAPPGSIRGDLAQTIGRNLVHGSDSPQSAEREIAIWFDAKELVPRSSVLDDWLVST